MSDRHYSFPYTGEKGYRLDKFLVECLPELSRSRLQGLIKDGFVRVDGTPAGKAGQDLENGQLVEVTIPPATPTDIIPEQIPLDILFENDDLLVVNKPAGMVVHPAAGHSSGTLVNAALAYAPEMEGIGGEQRPGIVHRLDKDTSGLILVAKNDRTHNWLQEQFRLRRVHKTYLALIEGHPPTPEGRIEAPIGRDSTNRKKMAVVSAEKGRESTSEYHTLETFPHHTLVEVHPLTGRTHQIRLHMAFLGNPVVGDKLYGRRKQSIELGRQFLHSMRLTFLLPGAVETRTFEAPLPDDLQRVLTELRQS